MMEDVLHALTWGGGQINGNTSEDITVENITEKVQLRQLAF